MLEKDMTVIRRLFTIEGCHHCHIWKKVLPEFNILLPPSLRINVIDCTRYHNFGKIDNPEIRRFATHIKGIYPVFFEAHIDFTGRIARLFRRDSANSEVEVRAWLKALVFKNLPRFVTDIPDDAMFNMDDFDANCKMEKNIFGRYKAVCKQ